MQGAQEILFEKFRVAACLKKDSYNAVYMADHIYLGKKIILKTLNTLELKDKVILERFKREARILASLDHPNLIKVLDFGTFGDNFYISFEYFQSNNLREVISQKKLSYDQKHHLLVQLLKALNIAHQNNIIHRDIKPENILVNNNYELKIADFGLAMTLDENALTNKASIVGTPGYMSPEQIKGETLSIRSDIFSTGTVALELFTGTNPFLGKNINETINNILNYEESDIKALIKELSPAVQQSIGLMLKKNATDRSKNINELLGILGVAGEIFTPVEVKIKKTKRRKGAYVGSFLLSVVFTVFLIYMAGSDDKPVEPIFSVEPLSTTEFKVQEETTQTDSVEVLIAENIETPPVPSGKIMIKSEPNTEVFINNRKISTTPLSDFISLDPGSYNLKLVHPDYPPYTRRIRVEADKTENLNLSLKDLAGYLDCMVYPWGEIYINDEYRSQTPLREPILLMPGKYKLTIKNPQFGSFSETITIKSKIINEFRYNFEDKN
jgi:eukaryotic-like serine/threonine-protein kinase